MHTVPSAALAHPSWCDASACTAPDRLAERGEDPAAVPLHRRDNHYGVAHLVPTTRTAEVELRLEAYRDVFDAVTDQLDGVTLAWAAEYFGMTGTLQLAVEQLAPLATAFASLRDLADPDRNPVADRVAEALRVLGCVTRGNAAALLGLTVVHLTDRERGQVLAQFPAGGDR